MWVLQAGDGLDVSACERCDGVYGRALHHLYVFQHYAFSKLLCQRSYTGPTARRSCRDAPRYALAPRANSEERKPFRMAEICHGVARLQMQLHGWTADIPDLYDDNSATTRMHFQNKTNKSLPWCGRSLGWSSVKGSMDEGCRPLTQVYSCLRSRTVNQRSLRHDYLPSHIREPNRDYPLNQEMTP